DDAKGGVAAAAPDGTVYVTSMGGVLRVSPDGKVTKLVEKIDEHVWTLVTSERWHYLMGLAPDARGNVYVANLGARKVKKVSPDGKVEVVLDESFPWQPTVIVRDESSPWAPTGIAVSPRSIYVLEYTDTGGSARVRRIDKSGKVTLLH